MERSILDWSIFSAVCIIGALFARYIYQSGLSLALVDQYSHLAISRQIFDSLTPGISQLGFWPPLLHMLVAPFSAIDVLYTHGLAAAFAIVPVVAFSAVCLYHLVLMLTGSQHLSALSVVAYVLNPYILYYAATPMTDALYSALVIIATYFFVHWWFTQRLASLVLLGLIVTLATLTRFEGLLLLGLAGVAVLYRVWREGVSRSKIEAVLIMFGLVAGIGLTFTLMYGVIFGGHPFAFMHDEWGAYAQQRSLFLPTEHNIAVSAKYLLSASGYMLGMPLVVLAAVSMSVLLLLLSRRRALLVCVALLLGSPFLFDLLALFQGSAVIYLPDLPPHDPRFFNERYGLYWIGFAVVMPALAARALYQRLSQTWYLEPVAIVSSATIGLIMVIGSFSLFDSVACSSCFSTIRGSLQTSPQDHSELTRVLSHEYDGGMILMTRALHNEIAVKAGIPLRNYILEANQYYYDQALVYPWLFAEWVIMQNPNNPTHSEWSRQNEAVARQWAFDPLFMTMYEEVFVGGGVLLYRLKHDEVLTYVREHGIPEEVVPSLSKSRGWNIKTTFAVLHDSISRAQAERFSDRVSGAP